MTPTCISLKTELSVWGFTKMAISWNTYQMRMHGWILLSIYMDFLGKEKDG